MQMGGRVPISNDFIMLLPRVIGDFVSTIGGTMDVCRDNGYRAYLPNRGKFERKKKRYENNIHFSQGNRSVSNNVARISNNNF